MGDNRSCLMMLDLDCWVRTRAITTPLNVPGQNVFRALQPFEADHGHGGAFKLAALDTAVSKDVDLFPCCGWLDLLHSCRHRDPQPWVWDIAIEFARVQAMYNSPCFPAK